MTTTMMMIRTRTATAAAMAAKAAATMIRTRTTSLGANIPEVTVLIACGLLAAGLWPLAHLSALIAPALVLLWCAFSPSRLPFIDRTPQAEIRPRAGRLSTPRD